MKRNLTIIAIVQGVVWLVATAVLLFFVAGLAPIQALLWAFVAMDAAFGLLFASYLVTNTRRAWPADPYGMTADELLRPPLLRHEERRVTAGTIHDRSLIERMSDMIEDEAAMRPMAEKPPAWRIDRRADDPPTEES